MSAALRQDATIPAARTSIHPLLKGLEDYRGLLDKPASLSPAWRFRLQPPRP
jgi:hypothetical protein